jgi:hypothetical protein
MLTTYYHDKSGIGAAIRPKQARPVRVGVIGLGTGTIAAYGQEGDDFRFYEINPDVVNFAKEYFTYLKDCAAKVEIVEGDARVKLTEELPPADAPADAQPPRPFDLIVLDAFSGDAVPAHLLTREAFETYLKLLASDGLIAAHVSSLHLDLSKVLKAHASDLELTGVIIVDLGNQSQGEWESVWILLSRDPKLLSQPPIPGLLAAAANALQNPLPGKQPRVGAAPLVNEFSGAPDGARWTDDFSNVLSILRGL